MQNVFTTDDAVVMLGLPNQAPVFTGRTTYSHLQIGGHAPNTPGVRDVSLGVTSSGDMYLAYADGGNVNVLTRIGNAWSPISNSLFSSSGNVDLVMSPTDEPYVSFVQGSDASFTVQKWVGNSWQDVGSASLPNVDREQSKLSFAADGTPYLAVVDRESGVLGVLRYDSGSTTWQRVGASGVGTLGMGGFDLKIGASGTPYVSFSNGDMTDAFDVQAFKNGVWTSLGAPAPVPREISVPYLVEDNSGTVYVAYQDAERSMVVARFDGAQWDVSPTDALPTRLTSPIDLLLGSDGSIQLAASGGFGYPNPLHVLSFDGMQWTQSSDPIFALSESAMATTPDGSIFIATMDPENMAKVVVQKFSIALAAGGITTSTALEGFSFTDAEDDPVSFSITGGADAAMFVVRGGDVRFERTPAVGTYQVEVTVSDGFNDLTKTVVVSVTAADVNHAPVLDVSASPKLANVVAGSGTPSGAVGSLVSALVDDGSDVDGNALGIALTGKAAGVDVYYSLNNGTTWIAVGALSESSAVLLDQHARVYVSAATSGVVADALSFKLWDQTHGSTGNTNVDTHLDPVVASFPLGTYNAQDIVLSGSVAFVVDSQNTAAGLVIVDVSDAAHPVALSSLSFEEAYEVAVQGDFAYVAMRDGLAIVNVSNLQNPTLVHTINVGRAAGVLVDGDLAYITGISGGLQIFDISSPTAPVLQGTAALGGDPLYESVLRDGFLYVADRNSGLHIFDVRDPQNPVWKGEATTLTNWAIDVALNGNIAYTAAVNSGLAIIDVTDPENPVVQSYLREGAENVMSVTRDGDLLYVGIEGRGIRVYDITNAAAPIPVRFIDTQGYADTSVVDGGHLHIASGNQLTVVDLNNSGAFSADTDTISQTLAANAAPVFDKVRYQQSVLNTELDKMPFDKMPLVKGADGSLYVAFVSDTGVVTAHQQGDDWQTIPYDFFGNGRDVQMTTDAQGVPYLVFTQTVYDLGGGGPEEVSKVTVLTLQNGQWQAVGSNWLDIENPMTPRLSIGADNTLYVTYTDLNNGALGVRHFVDGTWEDLGQSTVPGLMGDAYKVLIGVDGKPTIAFADANANNRLTVMTFDGNVWSVVPNPQHADVPAYQTELASDGKGFYVAYGDAQNELFVEYFDGSDWTMLPLPRTAGMLGSSPLPYDLAVGSDGALYLLASPYNSRNDFYVMRYAEGAWTIVSDLIDGARNTSIVLGDEGQVYVTAQDRDTGLAVVHEIDPVAQATALTTGTAVKLGAHDPEGSALTYTITGGTHQALFEVTADGIRFIEQPTAAGKYSVLVTIDDGLTHVTRMVSVTVTVPPNSAPVLDVSASPKLPDAELGGLSPEGAVGIKVSELLGDSASDADGNDIGMAVTEIKGGTLHYSVDGGTTWVAVTAIVSKAHALALTAETLVYFEAASGTTGTVNDALQFHAWDGTDGVTGTWLDLSGKLDPVLSAPGTGLADMITFKGLAVQIASTGLVVYDSTNPGVVLGTVATSIADADFVAAGDDFVYAVSQSEQEMYVISLATPTAPVVVQTIGLADFMMRPDGVKAYGNTVLVASRDDGVQAFTVAADGTATPVNERIPAAVPTALALDDTRYVVGNSTIGLMLVDRHDDAFTELKFADFPVVGFAAARDVVISGDYAYVATSGAGLMIADISDLSAPKWVGQLVLGSVAERLVVVERQAFVLTSNGVYRVDLSDPEHPVLGESFPVSHANSIAVVGKQLLVTTDTEITVLSGIVPGSVSHDSDTVAVDVRDTIAPTLTLPADHAAHLRGDDLSIESSEAGIVYLVKAGAHAGTPSASELITLEGAGNAVAMTVIDGKAVFDTTALLGNYLVYAVDVAGNVSSGAGNTVTIRTVETPPPTPTTPPVVPSTPMDGVPVEVSTGNDGQQQIKIPVVTNDRDEDTSTPNSKLADITLVKTAAGTPLLNLGIPVGTGVTANGPGTPVSGITAQTVLDGRITAADGSAAQKTAAQGFLSSLDAGTQVVVQTITISAQATSGGPLVISAGNTQDGHRTAVVIDTRALPAGTLIDLENVDFAIIIGDARVTGGAGANIAYGDDANQFIVLGEGDDILHGLGGDDTVGSLRGNDQVFGDDGNDIVYGGTGDDIMHGGAGNDRMNGGFGFDTGVQTDVLADYTVTLEGHEVVLTHKTSGEVDRFLDVEHITFDSGPSIIVAHEAGDVAGLQARFAGAQLIELNANRTVTGTQANDEVTPELGIGLNIDLGDGIDIVRLAGGRSDVHIDVETGQRAELTRLEDGAMLAFNNVELLAFANGDVTVLAHNHEEAVVGRAYELLLGRNVDTDGFTFWMEGIDKGASLHATLTAMMQSPEFSGAVLSNSAFLDLLYTTGFDRTADAAGKVFWLAALDSGVSRAQVLEGFAASTEAATIIGSTIDVTLVS
ncbi:DUF4214 domain-containing protein [Pigmentiphaga aceris]|uniref:DUF4214 domain-containing protein n=1 Tax=Pigmentiphaga aceris TaxID=1940612 RepID=A0A5C0AVL8_9BURK|nr:DUF4214 domain-containing protein [Pigmentiphaga aceris]QEI04970.1 DUF4214 domain-containing protein [Pigmentiphaga aceris]